MGECCCGGGNFFLNGGIDGDIVVGVFGCGGFGSCLFVLDVFCGLFC